MVLEELRKIIAEKNIKQKDICKALNISQSYTSELLNGKKEFSLRIIRKIV
ncbi:MAG: helix-turn-helix domain-containing protein [Treponema sp.]